jgi:hypothetical protein
MVAYQRIQEVEKREHRKSLLQIIIPDVSASSTGYSSKEQKKNIKQNTTNTSHKSTQGQSNKIV